MFRTVIYIRKSSDENSEKQIQSIERQRNDLFAFIERYNSTVNSEKRFIFDPIKDIIEEEYSAKKPWRPKFKEMIEMIQKKKYDILLCHELSRLSRNPIDNGILVHLLDIESLSAIQTPTSIFTNIPNDKFTLALFLNVAKFENDQRGKNTSSGMQTSKAKWGTTNRANMGYKNAGTSKWNRWIEEDGENFKILRKCWEMLLTGDYKINELYTFAIKKGFTYIKSIKTGEEEREQPSEWGFRQAFSNPYYKWYIQSAKWLIEGNHPKMVNDEEFEKAQVILQKHGFKHSKDIEIKYENLLEELLICGKSNASFYVDNKTRYYCPVAKCSGRYYSSSGPKECPKCHTCQPIEKYKKIEYRSYFAIRGWVKHVIPWKTKPVSSIDIGFMEKLIDKELWKITISEKLFQVLRKRMYTLWIEKESNLRNQINGKRKDINKKEDEISNLLRNGFWWESITDSMREWLESSIDQLKQKIKVIESEILEIRDELERSFEQVWQSINALLDAKTVFWEWSPKLFEPKRRLLFFVFSNLKFIDGKIIPEWKEPFATIEKSKINKQKSQHKVEISDSSLEWLPEQDSNLWPTG